MRISKEEALLCKLCNKLFNSHKEKIKHLKDEHNLSFREYIIKVYYNNQWPTCKCGCKTKLAFKSLILGPWFSEYTKNHFPRKKHSKETIQKIKQNTKQAILDNFGVENVYKLTEIKDKINKVKELRYNDKNYNNQEKIKETKEKRYNNENYNNRKQTAQTNLEKYGGIAPTCSKKIIEKIKKTKAKRYNNENYNNMAKTYNTKLEKYGYNCEFSNKEFRNKYNRNKSRLEEQLCKDLNGEQHFWFNKKEFDIKIGNNIVEVDGEFWHPKELKNLTFSQVNNSINDYEKNRIIETSVYNLYRIRSSKIKNKMLLEEVKNNSYEQKYELSYFDKIISKEYLQQYIENKGKDKLENYIPLLLKFIRTYQKNFPIVESKEELNKIINKIKTYDFSKIYENKIFKNNISNIGVSYLKSTFESYWKTNYKNHLSPVKAWNDDTIMYNIIKYRIGINKNNETFDFSLKNLVYGLSVNRYTVSFFKPLLAAAVYKYFLKDHKKPIVLDLCAGFGGRLLGFKSIYPNGTYIGLEPNKKRFDELEVLASNFNNVKIYNIKAEDFKICNNYNLVFTSIPYYDLENYELEYNSFEDWQNRFIKYILNYKNLVVNINKSTYNKLKNIFSSHEKFYIKNNTSPLNKTKKEKIEYLINFKWK